MVATAFMIESTLGFEMVVPMYMLLRVEDLRLSISSRSLASGTVKSTIYSIKSNGIDVAWHKILSIKFRLVDQSEAPHFPPTK